ncbi:hypothetical protein BESB_082410 [Besnoitia besnoiti]|uniref:Uncharacterized protein n=1 Tax=Besnoitia besnoiti TaxID=94643 RepID=A0A2A9MCC6_BESBE|nr:hypothetical protein BESB_082410 [Besnoitia besnoiti]PFH33042.1 hypothetical protein BESB_082410 [Besnoitia besnoiti]
MRAPGPDICSGRGDHDAGSVDLALCTDASSETRKTADSPSDSALRFRTLVEVVDDEGLLLWSLRQEGLCLTGIEPVATPPSIESDLSLSSSFLSYGPLGRPSTDNRLDVSRRMPTEEIAIARPSLACMSATSGILPTAGLGSASTGEHSDAPTQEERDSVEDPEWLTSPQMSGIGASELCDAPRTWQSPERERKIVTSTGGLSEEPGDSHRDKEAYAHGPGGSIEHEDDSSADEFVVVMSSTGDRSDDEFEELFLDQEEDSDALEVVPRDNDGVLLGTESPDQGAFSEEEEGVDPDYLDEGIPVSDSRVPQRPLLIAESEPQPAAGGLRTTNVQQSHSSAQVTARSDAGMPLQSGCSSLPAAGNVSAFLVPCADAPLTHVTSQSTEPTSIAAKGQLTEDENSAEKNLGSAPVPCSSSPSSLPDFSFPPPSGVSRAVLEDGDMTETESDEREGSTRLCVKVCDPSFLSAEGQGQIHNQGMYEFDSVPAVESETCTCSGIARSPFETVTIEERTPLLANERCMPRALREYMPDTPCFSVSRSTGDRECCGAVEADGLSTVRDAFESAPEYFAVPTATPEDESGGAALHSDNGNPVQQGTERENSPPPPSVRKRKTQTDNNCGWSDCTLRSPRTNQDDFCEKARAHEEEAGNGRTRFCARQCAMEVGGTGTLESEGEVAGSSGRILKRSSHQGSEAEIREQDRDRLEDADGVEQIHAGARETRPAGEAKGQDAVNTDECVTLAAAEFRVPDGAGNSAQHKNEAKLGARRQKTRKAGQGKNQQLGHKQGEQLERNDGSRVAQTLGETDADTPAYAFEMICKPHHAAYTMETQQVLPAPSYQGHQQEEANEVLVPEDAEGEPECCLEKPSQSSMEQNDGKDIQLSFEGGDDRCSQQLKRMTTPPPTTPSKGKLYVLTEESATQACAGDGIERQAPSGEPDETVVSDGVLDAADDADNAEKDREKTEEQHGEDGRQNLDNKGWGAQVNAHEKSNIIAKHEYKEENNNHRSTPTGQGSKAPADKGPLRTEDECVVQEIGGTEIRPAFSSSAVSPTNSDSVPLLKGGLIDCGWKQRDDREAEENEGRSRKEGQDFPLREKKQALPSPWQEMPEPQFLKSGRRKNRRQWRMLVASTQNDLGGNDSRQENDDHLNEKRETYEKADAATVQTQHGENDNASFCADGRDPRASTDVEKEMHSLSVLPSAATRDSRSAPCAAERRDRSVRSQCARVAPEGRFATAVHSGGSWGEETARSEQATFASCPQQNAKNDAFGYWKGNSRSADRDQECQKATTYIADIRKDEGTDDRLRSDATRGTTGTVERGKERRCDASAITKHADGLTFDRVGSEKEESGDGTILSFHVNTNETINGGMSTEPGDSQKENAKSTGCWARWTEKDDDEWWQQDDNMEEIVDGEKATEAHAFLERLFPDGNTNEEMDAQATNKERSPLFFDRASVPPFSIEHTSGEAEQRGGKEAAHHRGPVRQESTPVSHDREPYAGETNRPLLRETDLDVEKLCRSRQILADECRAEQQGTPSNGEGAGDAVSLISHDLAQASVAPPACSRLRDFNGKRPDRHEKARIAADKTLCDFKRTAPSGRNVSSWRHSAETSTSSTKKGGCWRSSVSQGLTPQMTASLPLDKGDKQLHRASAKKDWRDEEMSMWRWGREENMFEQKRQDDTRARGAAAVLMADPDEEKKDEIRHDSARDASPPCRPPPNGETLPAADLQEAVSEQGGNAIEDGATTAPPGSERSMEDPLDNERLTDDRANAANVWEREESLCLASVASERAEKSESGADAPIHTEEGAQNTAQEERGDDVPTTQVFPPADRKRSEEISRESQKESVAGQVLCVDAGTPATKIEAASYERDRQDEEGRHEVNSGLVAPEKREIQPPESQRHPQDTHHECPSLAPVRKRKAHLKRKKTASGNPANASSRGCLVEVERPEIRDGTPGSATNNERADNGSPLGVTEGPAGHEPAEEPQDRQVAEENGDQTPKANSHEHETSPSKDAGNDGRPVATARTASVGGARGDEGEVSRTPCTRENPEDELTEEQKEEYETLRRGCGQEEDEPKRKGTSNIEEARQGKGLAAMADASQQRLDNEPKKETRRRAERRRQQQERRRQRVQFQLQGERTPGQNDDEESMKAAEEEKQTQLQERMHLAEAEPQPTMDESEEGKVPQEHEGLRDDQSSSDMPKAARDRAGSQNAACASSVPMPSLSPSSSSSSQSPHSQPPTARKSSSFSGGRQAKKHSRATKRASPRESPQPSSSLCAPFVSWLLVEALQRVRGRRHQAAGERQIENERTGEIDRRLRHPSKWSVWAVLLLLWTWWSPGSTTQ